MGYWWYLKRQGRGSADTDKQSTSPYWDWKGTGERQWWGEKKMSYIHEGSGGREKMSYIHQAPVTAHYAIGKMYRGEVQIYSLAGCGNR